MAKILFIQPRTTNKVFTVTGGLVQRVLKKTAIVASPTLPTLAAMTPARFDVTLLDEDCTPIDFDQRWDIVAVTGLGIHVPRMLEIADAFRARGQFVVAGGIGVSVHRERCRPHFDVLFFGECEHVWAEFLADWEAGDFDVSYEGQPIAMDQTPVPRWDLLDLSNYLVGTVQGSRGCPFNCEFCDVVSMFGRVARLKPIPQILEEVDTLARQGIGQILFSDDNFFMNPAHTKGLLRRLIAYNRGRRRPLRFSTQITIDSTRDEELYDLLTEANFTSLFIGIESPNPDSLRSTDKKHNLKVDIVEAVRGIHARGITVLIGGTIGFDADGPELFDSFERFLAATGIAGPGIGLLTAWTGTRLWHRMKAEGRLLEDRPEFEFGVTNFHPKRMSLQELESRFVDFIGNRVASEEHFFEVLESYLACLDKARLNPGRNRGGASMAELRLAGRFLRYALWHKGAEGRRALARTLRLALRHGRWTIPFALEALTAHIVRREFTHSLPAYKRLMAGGQRPESAPARPEEPARRPPLRVVETGAGVGK